MADINLIPQEERINARTEAVQKRLQLFSIGALVLTAILTVVTLSLFAMFSSKRAELIAMVEDSSASINKLKAQEELIVVVKDKASVADEIIVSRTDYPQLFGKFSALIPQGIYFTDLRISGGKIIISGKAQTSSDVDSLSTSLLSAKGTEVFSDVSIDSLSSDDTGRYVFVLSAKLKSAEVEAIAPPPAVSPSQGSSSRNPISSEGEDTP